MTDVSIAIRAAAQALAERNACGYCHGECDTCTGDATAAVMAALPYLTADQQVTIEVNNMHTPELDRNAVIRALNRNKRQGL